MVNWDQAASYDWYDLGEDEIVWRVTCKGTLYVFRRVADNGGWFGRRVEDCDLDQITWDITGRDAVLYDTAELAALLGVKRASFRRYRASPARYRRLDGLPAPARQDPLLWDADAIDAWLAASPPNPK